MIVQSFIYYLVCFDLCPQLVHRTKYFDTSIKLLLLLNVLECTSVGHLPKMRAIQRKQILIDPGADGCFDFSSIAQTVCPWVYDDEGSRKDLIVKFSSFFVCFLWIIC